MCAVAGDGGGLTVDEILPGVLFEREYAPSQDSRERCAAALLAVLRAPRPAAEDCEDDAHADQLAS